MKIKIATRKSQLALAQANQVAKLLVDYHPNLEIELLPMVTSGDQLLATSLAKIGGKGLFTKEIEASLLAKQADLAVHSLKDLPYQLNENLVIGAIVKRADPRDVFIATKYHNWFDLPKGAVIGTSSLRRQAQLKKLRGDLQFQTLRGNINTRLSKLTDINSNFDAIILAAAGLQRLNLQQHIQQYFSPDQMLPAIGQGALAVQYHVDNPKLAPILKSIHHSKTASCVSAERAMQRVLEANCQVPVAGYATIEQQADKLALTGLVADVDGSLFLTEKINGLSADAVKLGEIVGNRLLAKGADRIINALG